MKRRLFTVTLLITLAALVVSSTPSHAAYVRRATVNGDMSVTIEWTLASAGGLQYLRRCRLLRRPHLVLRRSIHDVHDRAAPCRTAHDHPRGTRDVLDEHGLRAGELQALDKADVRVGLRVETVDDGHVRVPSSSSPPPCVVPHVRDLRIDDAKARIRLAKCPLGAVTRQTAKGVRSFSRSGRSQAPNFPRARRSPWS